MRSRRLWLAGLTLTLGSAFAPWVQAHDNAYLDAQTAPHGGTLRMAGPYHLELVQSADKAHTGQSTVRVYVTDHAGQAIPTRGAKGRVLGGPGKGSQIAALLPAGENAPTARATTTPPSPSCAKRLPSILSAASLPMALPAL
ncbi:MAG: hypothetical protein QG554_343, partial [Pseudomonadota bacterium]|nr:hypothetical protein [Pseudomonadota bacterium]